MKKKMANGLFWIGIFIPCVLWAQLPNSQLLAKVSFRQLTGGIILLNAQVGDFSDTLHFVFDTGSRGISLDSTTVACMKLSTVASDLTIRGIAGMHPIPFVHDLNLHFDGFVVDSLQFHVVDYDILSRVYGEKIDGVIGCSVLSRYIIKLDFDSLVCSFYTKGKYSYPSKGYILKPNIHKIPMQSARVSDQKNITTNFLYDMGAGVCLMFSKEFVKQSRILRKNKRLYPRMTEGVGGKVEMDLTVIKKLKIGRYRFRNVPTYLFEDINNITAFPQLSGIIGVDLMRRFNVVMDYDKKEFHISPNSHYQDEFDYTYSGLQLYTRNGNVYIGDVAKDSSPRRAGLKEGDRIMAIGGRQLETLNQYKLELQKMEEKVDMVILRDGKLERYWFEIVSITK
jgi:hypothetical protein